MAAKSIGRGATVHWRDARGDEWTIRLEWADIDGRAEAVGLTLRGASRVSAALLREVPLAELVSRERSDRYRAVQAAQRGGSPKVRRRAAAQLELYVEGPSASVAEVYREAFRNGDNPVQAVADCFGLSIGGARHRIAKARREGALGPAPAKGQAGELT